MQTHLDERYLETQTKPDVFGKAKERPKHRRVNFKGDGACRANDSGEDDNEEPVFRADDKKWKKCRNCGHIHHPRLIAYYIFSLDYV